MTAPTLSPEEARRKAEHAHELLLAAAQAYCSRHRVSLISGLAMLTDRLAEALSAADPFAAADHLRAMADWVEAMERGDTDAAWAARCDTLRRLYAAADRLAQGGRPLC